MALCMIYPVTEEYPPTFESFFPPQGLSLSIPFILTSDVGGSEIEKNLRFLYSPHIYHLIFCKLLGFSLWGEDHWHLLEDARGTDDSRVIMTSRQEAQGPHASPCTSLVQMPPQKIFLWALVCLGRCAYKKSMSTAPGWAGHGIQLGLENDLLSALSRLFFNFLESSHHTLIPALKI